MLYLFLTLATFVLSIFLLNLYFGYGKNKISLTLNDHYKNYSDHIKATEKELQNQGRDAEYLGKGRFVVDGEVYLFSSPTIPIFPPAFMQRTVLIKKK
ncbi:hypothetical protein [Salipaludibacillus daqingensis]|uniref:hypothetical protein n=1 Tax=Salipaludibacillus daqingensis TaxID=3041001 RepID=UPI002474BA9D|nr:hypothetical protein [Salipaludibacillus daqingensis]